METKPNNSGVSFLTVGPGRYRDDLVAIGWKDVSYDSEKNIWLMQRDLPARESLTELQAHGLVQSFSPSGALYGEN
jgi:hypothetical protein